MAQITARDGSIARLRWYYGNIYLPKDEPRYTTYSIHRLAAAVASQRAGTHSKPVKSYILHSAHRPHLLFQIAPIGWPTRLLAHGGSQYGYTNTTISSALQDAFHSVWEIVAGIQEHPIIDRYRQQLPKGVDKPQTAVHFHQLYNIPILEGDDDLIQPMLAHLKQRLAHRAQTNTLMERSQSLRMIGDDDLVYGVGLMLFRLVVLRVYMERCPSNDDEIYRLVIAAVEEEGTLKAARHAEDKRKALERTEKQKRFEGLTDREVADLVVAEWESKQDTRSVASFSSDIPIQATTRIVRRLTQPEQALAALMGWHDTTAHDDPQSVYPLHYSSVTQKGLIQVKEDLETLYDAPLAYVITPKYPTPYAWPESKSKGLTGGPPYVPPAPARTAAVGQASTSSAPRPKPRPRPVTRSTLKVATTVPEAGFDVIGPTTILKRKREVDAVSITAPKRPSKRRKRR